MKRMLMRIALGIILAAFLVWAGVFSAVCICAARERAARRSDCIIVLGARVWPDGRMSNALRYRCERALEVWKEGLSENIIVAGGQGNDEPAAEADVMRAYFLKNGVPEQNIIAENISTNTIQNMKNAREIMLQKGWKTAAVVTNDYHVQRALWIARDAQVDACGIAAPSPNMLSSRLFCRFRESLSWILYVLRRVAGICTN